MARGILSGLALGAVVSIGLAVGASLVMMPPSAMRVEPDADGNESAARPEAPSADEAVAEPDPVAEMPQEDAVGDDVAGSVIVQEPVTEAVPEAIEESTDQQPVETLTMEDAPAAEPERSAEPQAPVEPEVAEDAPAAVAEAPAASEDERPAMTIVEAAEPESVASIADSAEGVADTAEVEAIETEEVSALDPEPAEPVAEEAEIAAAELAAPEEDAETLVPSATEETSAVLPVSVLERGDDASTEPVAEAEVVTADAQDDVAATEGSDPAPAVPSAPAEVARPAEADTLPDAAPEGVIAGQEVAEGSIVDRSDPEGEAVAEESTDASAEEVAPPEDVAADPAPVEEAGEDLAQADLPGERPLPFQIIDDEAPEAPVSEEEDTGPAEVSEPGEDEAPEEDTAPAPRIGLIRTEGEAGFGNRGTGVRILRPGQPEAEEATEEAAPESEAIPEDAPAVRRFAAEFEGTGTGALVGIVLVDSARTPVAISNLDALGFPVTVGLDPGAENAAERMRALRSAGVEVALVPDVPRGATPADLEQAFGIYLDTVPEAVAVLDAALQPISSDRALLAQATAILGESGLGLVAPARGLTDPVRAAAAAGIPAATIYRELDGSDPQGMRRVLDQAAFQARQQGSVVLLGDLVPGTITALQEWSGTSRAGQVDLAPISAVLLEGSE
ncbi:divergent polysaccharide deacetylase family protein [Aestuariibius sp. 2305UL40-4]|uniref:divergent polysaccharide deacetylase family protein n=1 Tax=Aestuariibius violaceus TaxID=3234132 RepID=UPI00345E8C6D